MMISRFPILTLTAALMLSACSNSGLDWDLRSGDRALDTSSNAGQSAAPTSGRPAPDQRGVITYPDYQVVVAQRGDTVAFVAARVGVGAEDLARYNALRPSDVMRGGELLTLPSRIPTTGGLAPISGNVIGSGAQPNGSVDVTTIATTALDRLPASQTAAGTTNSGQVAAQSGQHIVKRGETAFQIARVYNVSARALADANGLGSDLEVREGQTLIIPSANTRPVATTNTAPGKGTPTPQPPSAKKPLPDETVTAAAKPKPAIPSPDLAETRTEASATTFAMPTAGKIIRGYSKGKSEGIDISSTAGSAVKAAASGTVAAITKNTSGTMIVVIKHANKLLTVYGGVDGLKVKKGDKVKKGQTIATVGAGSPALLHFEVREGVESRDPMSYLQ